VSTPAPRSSRRPPRARSGLLQAVLGLTAAQQRTAAAAVVVLVSLGTPWYSTEVVFPGAAGRAPSVSHGTMSGIAAFSFVEAAVLLVAAAVLVLVWGRATERSFSLPATDGTVVTGAAGWLGVLIVYRLFDRPEGSTDGGAATLIGLSWGIFATLAAVGLLLATGLDQRRRDAELRASTAAPADGPVLDPADVVPTGAASSAPERRAPEAPTAPAAGERPAWDGPAPATPGPAAPSGRPAWDGPPAAERPAAAPAPPQETAADRPSRSWSFDDPDGPVPPPPRTEPSRRRPVPPPEPTRPLGRDDAASQLRDAGLRDERPRGRAVPERGDAPGGPPAHDDPTRVAPRPAADEPTRAAPPAGGYDPATGQYEPTRHHDVQPPAPADDPDRGSRRRRRRHDES